MRDTHFRSITRYTIQFAEEVAFNRCQSTPAINQFHCALVNVSCVSLPRGHTNTPRCKRRCANHTPLPSQHNTFNRVRARLQKIYAVPSHGERPNWFCTNCESPSICKRPSTGVVIKKTEDSAMFTAMTPLIHTTF